MTKKIQKVTIIEFEVGGYNIGNQEEVEIYFINFFKDTPASNQSLASTKPMTELSAENWLWHHVIGKISTCISQLINQHWYSNEIPDT